MIFQNFVRAFLKAVGHRYIKRIPYTTPKGRRYRYIYRVSSTHRGRHAFDPEHLVEGTKFALHGEGESEFHGHITKVDGDQIKYVIDDGPRKGEEVTTTRAKLVAELNEVHGVQDKLTAERAKVKAAIAEAKRAGHGGVVRRLERRLRALGGEPEAQTVEATEREAESVEPEAIQRMRGVLDALSDSERLNTINPKNRKRPKEAKGADAKLIKLVNELAEDLEPNERRTLRVMASMLQGVERRHPRSAYERQESRKDRYAAIREFIERKLDLEPTVTAPNLSEIRSRPTAPRTRPSNIYGRAVKDTVDYALSPRSTGVDLNSTRHTLPTIGDLREMLSQGQRQQRAKEDLRSVNAPRLTGDRDPRSDIMYAVERYLRGPYTEIQQKRLKNMERGLMIALRDSRGEELEQVKNETARFWREWGGGYKRLIGESVTERTKGEALRNIRPLIPERALTPEVRRLLDQMENELDQIPVSESIDGVSRQIDSEETNKATRTTNNEST